MSAKTKEEIEKKKEEIRSLAEELKGVMDSFISAGFSEEQAFTIVQLLISVYLR